MKNEPSQLCIGSFSRQKKSTKARDVQDSSKSAEVKPDKADSGYGGMDSRESLASPQERPSSGNSRAAEQAARALSGIEKDISDVKEKASARKPERLNEEAANAVKKEHVEKPRQPREDNSSSHVRQRSQEKRRSGRRVSEGDDDSSTDRQVCDVIF